MSSSSPHPPVDYSGPQHQAAAEPLAFTLESAGGGYGDKLLRWLTRSAAVSIILLLLALLYVLTFSSIPAFRAYGSDFFTTSQWKPNETVGPQRDAEGKIVRDAFDEPIIETRPPVFGALAVIYGTAVSAAIALVFAVPLSFGAAIFLVRIAPRWLVPPVSFLVEFLAAIPSIAYGVWGLLVMAPFLQLHIEPAIRSFIMNVPPLRWGLSWMFYQPSVNNFGRPILDANGVQMMRELPLTGRDMFAGGLILAIMIIPIITAISRDVLLTVPRQQTEGAYALGATWWQSVKEMLKYSRSALYGAVMLGLARAAGETMAVTMVIGNAMRINPSPFAPAQTMSSLLANNFKEASNVERSSLTAVALILLLMSLLFNVVARFFVVGKNSRGAAAH